MPTYQYQCPDGHATLMMVPVSLYQPSVACETCAEVAERVFTAPILVKVAQDVHYTSPVTGEPITSHAARREDLQRHDCIPYDPEMKKDYHRRREESQVQLESAVERTICEEIAKMPTSKKAKLYSEVTEQNLTVEPVRSTPC
jgi:putative FmdB family regulatory protein